MNDDPHVNVCALKASTIFVIGWLVAATPSTASACKYTIRDIGFVSIHRNPYAVVIDGPEAHPGLEKLAEPLRALNLRLLFKLTGSGQPTRAIDDSRSVESWSAEIVSPDGLRLKIAVAGTAEELGGAVERKLATEIDAGALASLADHATSTFAQILVIFGSDKNANAEALRVVHDSVAALRRIEPMLPRPIALPVRLITIDHSQRAAESVLLWSLSTNGTGVDPKQPTVAVVYGAGRLAGPPAHGSSIVTAEVLAQLALIGESCECESSRDWVHQPTLPIAWRAVHRQQAAESLGFDPESPLVHAEVVRILSRGMSQSSATPNSRADATRRPLESLLLGYTESTLDSDDGLPSGAVKNDRATPDDPYEKADRLEANWGDDSFVLASPESVVRAIVVQGDGWAFDAAPGDDATADTESFTVNAPSRPSLGQAGRSRGPETQRPGSPLGSQGNFSRTGAVVFVLAAAGLVALIVAVCVLLDFRSSGPDRKR